MTQKLFLGVVGAGLTEACRLELNAGMALHKHMIVMSYPAFVPQLQPYFGPNLVEINPASPDGAEIGIVRISKPSTPSRMQRMPDRKSTRLNSSHLGISYA